jgi:hypothetical protein
VVLLLLPISLAMDNGKFDYGGPLRGGDLAAAAAVAVVVVDDNWRQKRPALRAYMVT